MDQTAPEPSFPDTPLPQNNLKEPLLFSIKRGFLNRKRVIFSLSLLTGAIIIGIFAYIQLSQKKPSEILPSGKKIKTTAFASDITLHAEKEDSLGVDSKSAFILSSKNPIDENKLKTNLTVEPQQDFNLLKVNEKEYKIAFSDPLLTDKIYKFKLVRLAEKKPETGIGKDLYWAFQIKNKFRIVSTLPRDKATAVPINSGIEITFSHENYKDTASFFEISPKAEGRFEKHKRTVSFIAKKLNYGTVYKVTIKKGLGLEGSSEILEDDYSFAFETQTEQKKPEEVRIGFVKEISEFSTANKPVLSVYSSSEKPLSKLNINVYKFKTMGEFIDSLKRKDAIPPWASYNREIYNADASILEKVLSFEAPLEKLDYNSYFIFPQTLSNGYYLVEEDKQKKQAWLIISDLATYLSVSKTKTLVWVNDLKSKKAAEEAAVRLYDDTFEQKTNSEGMAFFDTPNKLLNDKTRQYFTISLSSGEVTVVPVEGDYSAYPKYYGYSGGGYYDYPRGPEEQYWIYLYLDRQIYMPTDEVSFWGFVRNRDNPKEPQKIKVILSRSNSGYYDYNYQPVYLFEKDLAPSAMGTFTGEIPLKNFQPDYYTVEVKIGEETIARQGFNVETYTKPAYKIEIEPVKKAVFNGETAQFKGKTTFFEGTPVSRVKLDYSGIVSGQVETDEKGEFTISYQAANAGENNYPDNNYINVRPTYSEEGEIEAGTYVNTFGVKVNLAVETKVAQSKGKAMITAKYVDLEKINNNKAKDSMDYLGGPVNNLKISGKVSENRWEKREVGDYYDFINKVVSKRYEYYTVKTFLNDFEVTTNEDGKAEYQFEVSADKYYEIDLDSRDQEGHKVKTSAYLYGSEGSHDFTRYPAYDNYYYLERDNTEKAISIGDNIKLTFKKGQQILPSGSDNGYLYILAQRGIKDYKLANQPTYNFIFEEAFAPNIYAKAVYFNGETFVVSEGLPLSFNKEDKKLKIDTATDKNSYRPGETVNMEVAVQDKEGKGEKTEVNLNLIDEAIYKLQEDYVDPLGSLYRDVSSGIVYSYASHEYPLEMPQPGGGGGCFLAGTRIKMADSKEKKIENVKEGDFIETRESENEANMVKDKVTRKFEHIVSDYLLINNMLRVTKEHNLFVNGRWMPVQDLKIGDYLINDADRWVKVTSLEERKGRFKVYNLQTEKFKTFFAENFYVHNQKGRELFKDKAFFGSFQTDEAGKGRVSIKLPDNLTSWRVTSQAISNNLGAGNSTSNIAVSLPFFVDVILNNEYLEEDRPLIKLRSYGKELKEGKEVNYTFEAPTLGIEKQPVKGKAFESTFFQPGELAAGEHKITVGAKAGELEDKIIKTIKVKKTRLVKLESEYYKLAPGLKVGGNNDGLTTLVFSDQNRGRYYQLLNQLKYVFGDRADQKLARVAGGQLLASYFGEKEEEKEKFNPANYQTQNGGISLFPYSDDELELSAKAADLALDLFDKEALKQYFYKILENPKEGEERIAVSLYGLAACHEPVLVQINNLLKRTDLKPLVKLYLGLAATTLGDKETGDRVFLEVMGDYGEELRPYLRIKVGQDRDDILQATSIAADLAVLVGEESGEKLFAYLRDNATKDILIYMEDLYYLTKSLPTTDFQPVKFAYVLEGKKVNKTLEKGEIFKLQVTKGQIGEIRFEDISGNAGLASIFTTQFNPEKIKRDGNINISREYEVAGQKTTQFRETDLVKVTLNYQIGDQALDGCYQVTDWLPSGLKILTKPYSFGITDKNYWYPYEINNQQVKFCTYKNDKRPISYYARILALGDYKAEYALIQSLKSVDSLNFSNADSVRIK